MITPKHGRPDQEEEPLVGIDFLAIYRIIKRYINKRKGFKILKKRGWVRKKGKWKQK